LSIFTDPLLRRDLIKLVCLVLAIAGTVSVFIVTPSLSSPTVISIVFTMLLSPLVASLERRGYPRSLSIMIIFATFGVAAGLLGVWAIQSSQSEWETLKNQAPAHFEAAIQKLREFEAGLKAKYTFLQSVNPTDYLLHWGQTEGRRIVQQGPGLMGEILTWLFIVPPLTFVMLNEGRTIRKRFFHLVPNRYFESFFLISNEITTALSDYLRAKLVEAFLVGLMTTIGLVAVGAPYAIVLGVFAGVMNILPYLGPILGAVPGILIAAFDSSHTSLVWAVGGVYLAANVIDTVLIFPVIVAKLVNLHPLILIAVVMVGQQYYGLVGMLISIPAATALKVVLQEIYFAVYEQRSARGASQFSTHDLENAILKTE